MGPTAARWHARFVLAAKGIEVDESALVLQLVNALEGKDVESRWPMLRALAGRHGPMLEFGQPVHGTCSPPRHTNVPEERDTG
jgi:hypothetical protein